jgi:hypothetical protein
LLYQFRDDEDSDSYADSSRRCGTGSGSPFGGWAAPRQGHLPRDLLAEAAEMLDEAEGEFLPGWKQVEQETNGGRGGAADYVRSLRELAETARVDSMGALAANPLPRQDPRRAIPLLQGALERQPEREDLVRKLRAAYLETGQHTRAAELQRKHALDA